MRYKNTITGIVVSESHYYGMDKVDQRNYMAIEDEPIEQPEEDWLTEPMEIKKSKETDDGLGAILAAAIIGAEIGEISSSDDDFKSYDSDSSSDFGGFDGGDTGGGGASGDY